MVQARELFPYQRYERTISCGKRLDMLAAWSRLAAFANNIHLNLVISTQSVTLSLSLPDMSGKVQTAKQRKANEAFARKEDAKRGKPTRQNKKNAVKRTTSQKAVIGKRIMTRLTRNAD